MRRILAAPRAACWLFVFVSLPLLLSLGLPRTASAQTWNDPRTRALVERATARRAEQLADTGLTDYQATAHGYVTFLAQLGEGFPTPPKVIKADELELEVYWRAPNLSKQLIVGRRDTLLLPTDIAYHRDHLGIVQNNFPNIIRIGEGDEVADVPHPLSPVGLREYDYAVSDSFSIGQASQRIHVYEVKVRPKDDRQPRVVGAVYIDPAEGQVVRMNFSFTRAAFLDQALEELSVVLENRLVGGRFWLPSRQEIEIKRGGTWMDFPARGIIRGRWEIGDYKFNTSPAPSLFVGPEIVQEPPAQLKKYPWTGRVLDSLPPDVRAVTDADVQRVQAEARELVRARALERSQQVRMSARKLSDIAHVNRVEGLAVGDGVDKQLGSGFSVAARARYGIDDRDGKGQVTLAWTRPSGAGVQLFGLRDFRQAGDLAERSAAVNSLAAQEFGSDYSDPYFARGVGIGLDFAPAGQWRWRLESTVERQDSLSVHARPVTGTFAGTPPIFARNLLRLSLAADREPGLWLLGTELSLHAELRSDLDLRRTRVFSENFLFDSDRLVVVANVERPFVNGTQRLVTQTLAGILSASNRLDPPQELFFFGGPVSAPGYDFHSISGDKALSEHVEYQVPMPFPTFSLGRFGRVPANGTFAVYAQGVALGSRNAPITTTLLSGATGTPVLTVLGRSSQFESPSAIYPSVGVAIMTPFHLLRFDVARGLRRGGDAGGAGRWTFGVDVSREFWSIL